MIRFYLLLMIALYGLFMGEHNPPMVLGFALVAMCALVGGKKD